MGFGKSRTLPTYISLYFIYIYIYIYILCLLIPCGYMYDTQPSTLPTTGQETQLQAKQAAEETCTEQILEQ